jgi:small subunit ribosomal protein S5
VLEAAGVKDVLSKSLGSNTRGAVVAATMEALKQLRSAAQIMRIRNSD